MHYIIPLWFHVLYHSNGNGRIEYTTIIEQVALLNNGFRALTAGHDVKIEFILAGAWEYRNDDWFKDREMEEFREAHAMDQDKFVNIYINDIPGEWAGFGTLPQETAGLPEDGVRVDYEYVGDRVANGRVLIHEMGHYLGLFHVFYPNELEPSSCANTYQGGDFLVDTPPQSRSIASCADNSNTCNTPDALDNYMGYATGCMDRFTREQANRMVCSLVNYRSELFTIINPDRDGDGVLNEDDAFPDDPTETTDSDNDGVGNNSDAFPYNPTETADSDGDGYGDNEENDAGSDPLDSNDEPFYPGLSLPLIKAIMDKKRKNR